MDSADKIRKDGAQMYRVAICEDNSTIAKDLYGLCSHVLSENGISFDIAVFSDPEALLCILEQDAAAFHVLLLDIKMKPISGLALAHCLREAGNRISIIFVTGHEEYLREGYDVQPVHFLLKPVTKEALQKALKTDLDLNYISKTVSLEYGNKRFSFDIDRILYLESQDHTLYVQAENDVCSFRIPLSRIQEALPASRFCRCHNSFIVNLSWIREIMRTELSLKNGKILPVGRRYFHGLQTAFTRFLNTE